MLSDNPFPSSAILDPFNDNPQINGVIFNEQVFDEEIKFLRQKIELGTNVIYVAGLKFDKGIGKSALIAHEWRRLKGLQNVSSVYVRCKPGEGPGNFCKRIIIEWHRTGYLWNAFRNILLNYASEEQSLKLSKESVETMFSVFKEPPETLPLTLYTYVTKPDRLADDVTRWLSNKLNVNERHMSMVIQTYLTYPSSLSEKLERARLDEIEMFRDFLVLLEFSGIRYNYFFLDQLEDAIMATSSSKLNVFCVAIRRMIEAAVNKASIIVTLHPDSEMKLDTQQARDLLGIAPLDLGHRVDVMSMEAGSELTIDLSLEYLNFNRTSDPPFPTFPFSPEVLRYVCFLKDGQIRAILQQLHECIKFGASKGSPPIDIDFVLKHPRETLGALVNKSQLAEFEAYLGSEKS
jgi:hypothetical protein